MCIKLRARESGRERERNDKDLEQCSIRLGRVDLRVIESKCLGNGFILKY